MSSHVYFYLNRPPGPGCQPDGFTSKETWLPKQFPQEFPRGAWGLVAYQKPLNFVQIDSYDLLPQNLLEKAVYVAWLEADRDSGITQFVLDSYWQLSESELGRKILMDDFTAFDVKRLKDNGYTWEQVLSCLNLEAVNA